MMDIYETLKPLVDRVARSVHSSFPGHHSQEDTEQAIWVWVYESKASVAELIRTHKSWERQIYSTMTKVATAHLKSEDQATYGYSSEDVYTYPRDLLEEILEMVFSYEDWQSFAVKLSGMPGVKGQANETGNQLAQYADVKRAIELLPEDQYNAIVWRYKLRYTQQRIGEEMGISRQAAGERVRVAVSALQRSLGQKPLTELRDGYSGRQGRAGTAEANATIERQYEG
jgi:RNA polymerase sigma factor (sigma-70 family)